MKEKLKKIGSVLLDVLIVIVFIISTVVVIASITANRTGAQPNVGGYVLSSVQTDSMQGTVNKGDLVVGRLLTDSTEIKKGDIISFYSYYQSKEIIVTHRVVDILDPDSAYPGYVTQGDNEKFSDDIVKSRDDIYAIYQFRVPFVGGFIDFLKTPLGFIICLVLPLLSFIVWQGYKLISLYLKNKKLELEEAAAAGAASAPKSEISDEEKDAIIREYLAKKQAEEAEAQKNNAPQSSKGGKKKKKK